ADLARQLELQDDVQMSGHERKITESVLADVVEALVAALYLDGGFTAADQFIRTHWAVPLNQTALPPEDVKSRLQEWAQSKAIPLPEYKIIAREGPDHQPVFTIEVSLSGYKPQQASGASKQAAEKEAARKMLEQIDNA